MGEGGGIRARCPASFGVEGRGEVCCIFRRGRWVKGKEDRIVGGTGDLWWPWEDVCETEAVEEGVDPGERERRLLSIEWGGKVGRWMVNEPSGCLVIDQREAEVHLEEVWVATGRGQVGGELG